MTADKYACTDIRFCRNEFHTKMRQSLSDALSSQNLKIWTYYFLCRGTTLFYQNISLVPIIKRQQDLRNWWGKNRSISESSSMAGWFSGIGDAQEKQKFAILTHALLWWRQYWPSWWKPCPIFQQDVYSLLYRFYGVSAEVWVQDLTRVRICRMKRSSTDSLTYLYCHSGNYSSLWWNERSPRLLSKTLSWILWIISYKDIWPHIESK